MDISFGQKIDKEKKALNDALDLMDLIDIYRIFHPKAEEYTFFSSAHRTFSRIYHILGHRSSLHKFKKIQIILSIFLGPQCPTAGNQKQGKNCKKKKMQNLTEWRLTTYY